MKQISRGAIMCAPDTKDVCVPKPTSFQNSGTCGDRSCSIMTITVATLASTATSNCVGKLMHGLSSDAACVYYGEKIIKVNQL